MNFSRILTLGVAALGLSLLAPTAAEARDHGHRGHSHGDSGPKSFFQRNTILGRAIYNSSHRGYSNRGYYNRGYYNRGYYGSGYYGGYSPYAYGYGGYDPYYYDSYASPGISFSYVSAPRYSRSSSYRSSNLVVEAQRELKRRGYYRGGIDGVFGRGTANAIANFQSDERLRVNGRLDSDTIDELNID